MKVGRRGNRRQSSVMIMDFPSALLLLALLLLAAADDAAGTPASMAAQDLAAGRRADAIPSSFVSPRGFGRRLQGSLFERTRCRSPGPAVSSSSSSLLAASSNSGERRSTDPATVSGGKRRFASPEINAYTRRQISKIFGSDGEGGSRFVPLSLAGRWSQKSEEKDLPDIETILLSSIEDCQSVAGAYERHLQKKDEDPIASIAALPIPIPPSMTSNAINLLSRAYSNTPLSKSVLLSLNSLLVNRDGGLFDNLPWSTWTVDPKLSERDAANNVVEEKYTMGKRVAYQRFVGKDWRGRSLSLGNLARRVRYMLERDDENDDNRKKIVGEYDDKGGSMDDEGVMLSLSRRLLQLEVKEATMEVAECDQRLAISKAQTKMNDDKDGTVDEEEAEKQLEVARERLKTAEESLEELTSAIQSGSEGGDDASSIFSFTLPWNSNDGKMETSGDNKRSKTQSLLVTILDKLSEEENPPPYRGAIGYPAKIDSREEMFEDSALPYASPYDLLLEIADEQLNSEVVGCVLEPASLLEGNLVLGGALLLRRKGVQKTTTLDGERVYYADDDDDLGNEGVLPRSMYVVECFSDEALGVAVASGMPLLVEEGICGRAGSVPFELDMERSAAIRGDDGDGEDGSVKDVESLSFVNRVPPVRPSDESYFATQLEGEAVSSERESNSVRIPLTTNPQLFGGPNQVPSQQQTSSAARRVFSTFNPVKSLDEYDSLTDDAKARLLLKLESFRGVLPRPRALRSSKSNRNSANYEEGASPPSILDELLLPLVDESVRRQHRIRDAERRGDTNEAAALRDEAGPRQDLLERARRAREEGMEDEASRLEEEARLYAALRADVTQDEGAYSRYLDRDDWYERETRARIKRTDRSKFGTLLDGIDLP